MKWLIIVAILLLAACSKTADCSEFDRPIEADVCLNDKAISTGTVELCDKVIDSDIRNNCYAKIYGAQANLEGCATIEGKARAFCESLVVTQGNDSRKCSVVSDPDWRDICYTDLALKLDNFVICQNVDRLKAADECFVKTAHDTLIGAPCAFVYDATEQAKCFFELATLTRSVSLCHEIRNETIEWSCISRMARLLNESTLCDRIELDLARNSCQAPFK